MMRPSFVPISLLVFASLIPAKEQAKEQKAEEYFKRWLNEEVVYIITDQERDVFNKLTTVEEKERFIEQFWLRRDPTPGTAANEYKEEHYRRIAYANERFRYGGIPGWKTDRGRIYITHGPPDEIEAHPSGGTYMRPYYEGGGSTWTFPFEIWRYRHIEGLGSDIEIEFVDPSFSGEYRMALSPYEKDALLHMPKAGATLLEKLGLERKEDRPYFTPGNANNAQWAAMHGLRSKDRPFARMEQYFNLQRPPEIKYKDLKAVVQTQISYNLLAFDVRQDLIYIDEGRSIVPISIEVPNENLAFTSRFGIYNAQVNLYGVVTSLGGRVVAEFEDSLNADYTPSNFERGRKQRSIYQKMLALAPGVYKLDLILKDVHSGKMGTSQMRISVPRRAQGQLTASSLMLARRIQPVAELNDNLQQYVIGDLKVIPNVEGSYTKLDKLAVYLQVYNAQIDQATARPYLKVDYLITKGDRVVAEIQDLKGSSVQFFSDQRVVLLKNIPLAGFEPGTYKLKVVVTDRISGETVWRESDFKVVQNLS